MHGQQNIKKLSFVLLTDTQFSLDVVHTVGKDYLLPLFCCVVGHKWYSRLRTNGYLSFMVF